MTGNSFFLPQTNRPDAAQTNIHVMVDLETLGTHPESPIISIGAVLFDPMQQDSGETLYKRSFLRRITLESSLTACPKVDPATIAWWFTQQDEAIKALVGPDAVALRDGITTFRSYCSDRYPRTDDLFFQGHSQFPLACMMWAKSPDFDAVILSHAFKTFKEIDPFAFWQRRCVRTIQDLAWPNGPETRPDFHAGMGVKHDARADAVAQAMTVQAAYLKLGLSQKTQFSSF
jgi:exodeoxyribonuclease VIII